MIKTILLTLILSAVPFSTLTLAQEEEHTTTKEQPESRPKVYMISNAHLDTQWNWDVVTTIEDYIPKTMKANFTLFELYPGYVFNFEGAVKYTWMKEYYPEDYQKVKQYIRAGKWNVCGSTWDATDPNMPSPESLIRNILYGQQYYSKEFGTTSCDIFLPDCFGFGQTLPTVATHCGLLGFSTQKLQWRQKPFYGKRKIPFPIGMWQGIDGSRIMMCDDARDYSKRYKYSDITSDKELKHMVQESGLGIAYRYYGTGDTGGSPTMESVRTVVDASCKQDGELNILITPADKIYKDFQPFSAHPELPVWNDELLMDVHATGCYTSQAAMKLLNRRNEQMGDAAERALSAALWLNDGVKYPYSTISSAWKRVIWHQFHDDLTGTSIPRAYEFSWNDELISLNQFEASLTAAVQVVSDRMDTKVAGTPVVLYNPLGWERCDMVTIDVPNKAKAYSIHDENGRKVNSQITADGKLTFTAKLPSAGYAVYDLRESGALKKTAGESDSVANVSKVENSIYSVIFDENGDIAAITDKRTGHQLVSPDKPFRLALFTSNPSYTWPAWEILRSTMEASSQSIPASSVELTQDGPVSKVVTVKRKYGKSTFVQEIILHEGELAERIDVRCRVHWEQTNALLKAEFPMALSNPEAIYDLGIGAKARGNNTDTKYEVYAHQWADLTASDGTYGVAILNDCKYGWDKPSDNTLRLTLLHTPETKGRYEYQAHQDHGDHEFTYSIVGHKGDYRAGGIVQAAAELNQPAKAWYAGKHNGKLGRKWSFAGSSNEAVSIRAIKPAEDGSGFVVRVYETAGKDEQEAFLSFAGGIASAQQLDGCENVLGEADVVDGVLKVKIQPYGIRTYRIVPDGCRTEAGIGASIPLNLPYNERTATYNGFKGDVNYDGVGNSMAAELLPSELDFAGTHFQLGNPTINNAVRCDGQEISLPTKAGGVLYLLCNSTIADVSTTINIGKNVQSLNVPYWSGFTGQWGHVGHTEGYFKGADVAYVGTHTHSMANNKDRVYEYSYIFCHAVNVPAGCTEITLPKNAGVHVFAATMVPYRVALKAAGNLGGVNFGRINYKNQSEYRNLLKDAAVVEFSAEQNERESVAMLVDDNPDTKWCDAKTAGDKFVVFDLGKSMDIHSWYVLHAGFESESYITSDFALQGRNSLDEPWVTVDSVSGNRDYITNRSLDKIGSSKCNGTDGAVRFRYVKLLVTQGSQHGKTARIYEFAIH